MRLTEKCRHIIKRESSVRVGKSVKYYKRKRNNNEKD